MSYGTIKHMLEDTTLSDEPVTRTITYHAPFTTCDREADYAEVWAALDALEGGEP